jgi:hypothetical protein
MIGARTTIAHDDLIATAYRAEADALEIGVLAKRRLADEHDAAQERGDVAKSGDTLRNGPSVPSGTPERQQPPTSACPAKKTTKPARSAMPKSATRASFAGRSIGPAVNFTKTPDTRRLPGPDRGLRCLLGQSTAAGQNSAA